MKFCRKDSNLKVLRGLCLRALGGLRSGHCQNVASPEHGLVMEELALLATFHLDLCSRMLDNIIQQPLRGCYEPFES